MKIEKTNVLIVGAGPAGLSAALELKRLGVTNITVVDRESEPGGMPRMCHHVGFGLRDLGRIYSGPQYARHYVKKALANGVNIRKSTTITGWKNNTNTVTYTSRDGLGEIDAEAILLATGCRERPRAARLIPGNRLQGVFTTGSLQRFAYEYKLPIGKKAVIIGAELVSLSAIMTLKKSGLDVEAMVTELPQHQIYFPYTPMKWLITNIVNRIPIRTSTSINKILGSKRVEGIEIKHFGTGKLEQMACDTIIFTGNWIPENEIAHNGNLIIDSGTNGPVVDTKYRSSRKGVFIAGNLLRGVETADQSALEGRQAAQYIHEFLLQKKWSEKSLVIKTELPITWVFPNNISVSDKRTKVKRITFRVDSFYKNALIQIMQGNNTLYSRKFNRLYPNQTMYINGKFLAKMDNNGEPLKIIIA